MRRGEGFYGWPARLHCGGIRLGNGFLWPPVYLEFVRQSRGWPIALGRRD